MKLLTAWNAWKEKMVYNVLRKSLDLAFLMPGKLME
jgi:hypothetical protein